MPGDKDSNAERRTYLAEIVREDHVDGDLDAALRDELVRCFPHSAEVFSRTRFYNGAVPIFSVIVRDGPKIIAHLGVVDRPITAGGGMYRIAGVQNVFVIPEYRGQGLGGCILDAAMRQSRREHFDAGLLFCGRAKKRVYASNGWLELTPRRYIMIENGKETVLKTNGVQMYYPLAQSHLPDGEMNLGGRTW